MIINFNLSKLSKRKKVPPVPAGDFVNLAGKVFLDDSTAAPPSPARPAARSTLIDHGKAPRADGSVPPLPAAKHRPTTLIDHGKQDPSADSRPPLPPVRKATPSLIDHGKVF